MNNFGILLLLYTAMTFHTVVLVGDDCGRIVIWNMLPVRSEDAENNDKIPKILCQMENHQGKIR